MDWTSTASIAGVVGAFCALGGYLFAAGGKNASIEQNTRDIRKVSDENDARYATFVTQLQAMAEKHYAFELTVAREYVSNQTLKETVATFVQSVREISGKVDLLLGWTKKTDADHH